MPLCPNCRRLDADPGSVHNRGRLLPVRTHPGDGSPPGESRPYTCRHCGALWDLTVTARSPRLPLPAECWSLREAWRPREAAESRPDAR